LTEDRSQNEILLEVQSLDIDAERLRHRRRTLPEASELSATETKLADLGVAITEAASTLSAVAERQRRLEADLALLEEKISTLERRLYSGEVNVPKELQALTADIDSLRRRQSVLEDEVLAVMEEREPLEVDVAQLDARRSEFEENVVRLRETIREAQAGIDDNLTQTMATREAAASELSGELTQRYELLRDRLGGVGAARLVNGSCGGCHLTLPATELARIARLPADELALCDQCGRILVR